MCLNVDHVSKGNEPDYTDLANSFTVEFTWILPYTSLASKMMKVSCYDLISHTVINVYLDH